MNTGPESVRSAWLVDTQAHPGIEVDEGEEGEEEEEEGGELVEREVLEYILYTYRWVRLLTFGLIFSSRRAQNADSLRYFPDPSGRSI